MSENSGFHFVLNKDYLIVEMEVMDMETPAGLVVTNSEYVKGTVVCAGKGFYTHFGFVGNPYKEGDKILLDRQSLESAKVRKIPQSLYEDGMEGSRVISVDVTAYLISSDLVLGKWEKRTPKETQE